MSEGQPSWKFSSRETSTRVRVAALESTPGCAILCLRDHLSADDCPDPQLQCIVCCFASALKAQGAY